jgi:3-phenylpropionate/trans-cinnamate dioxygenase ferredoxin reductase component
MTLHRVLVAGASLAGLAAVEALRRGGCDAEITVVGEEHWLPYDRPPLSKDLLCSGPGEHPPYLREESAYSRLNVNWIIGRRCTSLDRLARTVTLDDGSKHSYDVLLIATGARARTLPELDGREGVHALRTYADLRRLHAGLTGVKSVAIVGGGFIGCEVASSLRQRGFDVTLVDMLPTLLAGPLGVKVGEFVTRLHREHGVRVMCGSAVVEYTGGQRIEMIRLADGHTIDADLVVLGLGAIPNTEWLTGSGIRIDDGVVCDPYGRTADPRIFAAGDVARVDAIPYGGPVRIEHWTNASLQGAAVGANMIAAPGHLRATVGLPYFWSEQYGSRLQYVGLHRRGDQVEIGASAIDDGVPLAVYHRDGIITAAASLGHPRLLQRLRLALGKPVETQCPSLIPVPW